MGDTQHMTQLVLDQHNYTTAPIVHCGCNIVSDTQHMTQLDLDWRGYIISPIVHSISNME